MKQRDRVLYTLSEAAVRGQRRLPSVDAVAALAGVPRSTTGSVVHDLCEVGAARWTEGSGELVVCAPQRLLDLYKVTWRRGAHRVGHVPEDVARKLVAGEVAVWGGARAAVEHLNGAVVASPVQASVYVGTDSLHAALSESSVHIAGGVRRDVLQAAGDVGVYRWDGPQFQGHAASVTQTLTELFNTPGWVAGDFYSALWAQTYGAVDER